MEKTLIVQHKKTLSGFDHQKKTVYKYQKKKMLNVFKRRI